jgi:D-Ala-D-Ala carboxypeptidase 3 (S13) family
MVIFNYNKTGTMSGVSTLAGYADTKSHGRVRFVIAMKGNGGATRFQVLKVGAVAGVLPTPLWVRNRVPPQSTPIFALDDSQLEQQGIVLETMKKSRNDFADAFDALARSVETIASI